MKMNTEERLYNSSMEDLDKVKDVVRDVVKIIENSSGKNKRFRITETNAGRGKKTETNLEIFQISHSDGLEKKKAHVKITDGATAAKPCSVYTCMQTTNAKIKSTGDFLDYLFWSLCPSLCAIRSIMYMVESCKKAGNHNNGDSSHLFVFSIDKDEEEGGIISYNDGSGDDDDNEHISFYIYLENNFLQIKIAPDLTHLICFPNGKKDTDQIIILPQVHSSSSYPPEAYSSEIGVDGDDNTLPMEKDMVDRLDRGVCYLEQISFAGLAGVQGDSNNVAVVPNPQISKVVNILLETLNGLAATKQAAKI